MNLLEFILSLLNNVVLLYAYENYLKILKNDFFKVSIGTYQLKRILYQKVPEKSYLTPTLNKNKNNKKIHYCKTLLC